MNRPILFMMHGDYGSGKSTFARQLAEELPATWLRSDRIRAELRKERQTPLGEQDEETVFDMMNAAAFKALADGGSVIYDGSRDVKDFRRHTRAATADRLQVPAVVIWMQTPIAECVRRAANRGHDEHAVIIKEAEVRANTERLVDPAPDELHIAVDGMERFAAQYQQFTGQLENILD